MLALLALQLEAEWCVLGWCQERADVHDVEREAPVPLCQEAAESTRRAEPAIEGEGCWAV